MGNWTFQPHLDSTESVLGEQMIYQYWEESSLFGYPVKYLQASELANNKIFSESTSREFLDNKGFSFKVKKEEDSIYNGIENYGGFGYTPSYSNIFYIATKYFDDEGIEPIEGDLVFDEIEKVLYEITKVDTKTETQLNLRINDTIFARKIYLKQYTYSYKDDFDTDLEDELFTDDTNLEELDKLNDTLRDNITNEDVLDETDIDKIFGDLG